MKVIAPKNSGDSQPRQLPKAFTIPPHSGLMNSHRWLPNAMASCPCTDEVQRCVALTMADSAMFAQGVTPHSAPGILGRPVAGTAPQDIEWLKNEMERPGAAGRSIIPISALSDKMLKAYIERLRHVALGLPTEGIISPHVVPFMLGGIPDLAVQELCYRAMDVMEIYYEPQGASFHDAIALVNTGEGAYAHYDSSPIHWVNRSLSEELQFYKNRIRGRLSREKAQYRKPARLSLSIRQDELVNNTPARQSFADSLLNGHSLFVPVMYNRLARIKMKACAEVAGLFQEGSKHVSNMTRRKLINGDLYDYNRKITITELTFSNAVRRVFSQPWVELDLYADEFHIPHDVEVALARSIIGHLACGAAAPPMIGPEILLGMSLLTGVPMAKWVEFAVRDLTRRGETFLNSETVIQAVELVDSSELSVTLAEPARDELRRLRRRLDSVAQESTIAARMAQKMRSGRQLLFPALTKHPENSYHLVGFTEIRGRNGLPDSLLASYRPRIDRVFTGEKQ